MYICVYNKCLYIYIIYSYCTESFLRCYYWCKHQTSLDQKLRLIQRASSHITRKYCFMYTDTGCGKGSQKVHVTLCKNKKKIKNVHRNAYSKWLLVSWILFYRP